MIEELANVSHLLSERPTYPGFTVVNFVGRNDLTKTLQFFKKKNKDVDKLENEEKQRKKICSDGLHSIHLLRCE